MVDTAVADDIPADCTITSDNYEAGVIIGKYFLQKHNTAKLVMMTHESARSARERVGGFLDTVSANENIQVVKKIECEGQVEIAMPHLQEAIDEGLDFDTVFCLNDLAAMWKTWKRKSAERLCRRCFCENRVAGRVAGRPGRGTGEEKELWCPAAREKTGKKRKNPRRAGHGEQKEAFGAPPSKKKQGRREKIRGGRGMEIKRKPLVPRRQRKNREEERKSEPGGAQGAKRSSHTPPAINK